MATGTAVWPESGTHKLPSAAGLGRMPYGHNEAAAEDAGDHGPLHPLHLEAKLRKLWEHILAFDDPQVGEERRANNRAAAQRIAKGIEVAQRQFRTFHAPDETMVG